MGHAAPPRKWPFLPKNGLKMLFFAQNQCFLGSGGQFNTPHPIVEGPDKRKHVLQGWTPRTLVIQGRSP